MTPPAQSRVMAEAITGVRDESELRPRLFLSASDVSHGSAEWNRLELGTDELVVACSVTTRQSIGKIPTDFFASVLRSLHHLAPNARIVLTGSRDDAPVLERMATSLGEHVSISAGSLTLRGFAAFLARCSVHFCMDSGPRHLANAVGTPVVFTRNLAVREAEAGAYCPTELDVMPAADYLTSDEISQVLAQLDPNAVAATIIQRSRRGHTPVAVTT
jgi:ADP-heptose:LPS heptosyltransferase